MTTDQRVIECAKAVLPLLVAQDEDGRPVELDAMVPIAEQIARACILKWLERGPSVAASMAALETGAILNGEYPLDIGHMETLCCAMNAQAAKEISGE